METMKAYKAFDRNMQCRGFQYEEGKLYEIEGAPILCEHGFHFCKDLVLTLAYYPVTNINDNHYAEVEILGEVEFEKPTKHKGVTNKIRVIRVLPDKEVTELVDKKSNSGSRNSGSRNSGNWNSGYSNSGNSNSGNSNSGYSNSGSRNSGSRNSGNWNSGYSNSGSRNSGSRNSGYWNSGCSNSGCSNSGSSNSGNSNSGYSNSGSSNSGNSNSGNWNSANRETGFFNTKSPSMVNIFNKPCSIEKWENAYKPDFLYFDIIDSDYKKSFMASYEQADKDERKRVLDLPNFDADLFHEISGIDLRS